jgi:class 3 adenylate cyclase
MEPDDLAQHLNELDIEDAEKFRRQKETAILVIMFIDMVHSTALREKLGELKFEQIRRQQKQKLMAIIEHENHGKVIKDTGDGLLGVFAMPDIAVRMALQIQEDVRKHPLFKVRIGLDMGQVTQESEQGIVKDVFGRHVNRASRLESLGDEGHILVSYTIWDSAKGWLKHLAHIGWKKHGSYRLKGITEPQIVYEPYDTHITRPLKMLHGDKVNPEEELTYCHLCGRYVMLKETFTCRTCGTAGICTTYCYDASQRQCIECAAQISTVPDKIYETAPHLLEKVLPHVQPDFDIFLVYAQQDKTFVMHLAEYFVHEGLRIWIDAEQIDIGDPVSKKIKGDLVRSRFVLICLSKHFTTSSWCRSELATLLRDETKRQNSRILPIVVGEYQEVDIPEFLYDKYAVDVRDKQGLERLMRKVAPDTPANVIRPDTGSTTSDLPDHVQHAINELQQCLLMLSTPRTSSDATVFEFDKLGLKLFHLLKHFPLYFEAFSEVIAEYQHLAEKILLTLDNQELRRVLTFRFRKIESCIEDFAGGFNYGGSFLGREFEASDSLYSWYGLDELEIEQWANKLVSQDDLEESEGIDWLLRAGFAEAERRLQQIAQLNLLDDVLAVLWKRMPRVFLHYTGDTFWGLVKYMMTTDHVKWKLRFYALKHLLKRSLKKSQAAEILQNFVEAEQRILSAFLVLHPKRECRAFALKILPPDDRWDILLCPKVPLLIIKELVEQSCHDSSESYVKALFLLLRPRLLMADSPLALGETYHLLNLFYHQPLFLQETFFHALTELHRHIIQKAQAHPVTGHLEEEFAKVFQTFCSKRMLKDTDITEMRHIPLPIQRKLAHDGYLPKYFICNIRDIIALETVRHVERRPDVAKFLRLRRINASALEKLASNKLVMQEYQNRTAFCHHPKANTVLVRRYISSLNRSDIKEISRNRNVSAYARELATKYLSRYG